MSTTPTNQPPTPAPKEPKDARLLRQHFPNANNLVFDKTKKGYVPLPILIRKAMKYLSAVELRVLVYLQTRCSKYSICYPTLDEIAHDLNLKGLKNLNPHIRSLEKKRFISTATGGGKKYFLVHDPVIALVQMVEDGVIPTNELFDINLLLGDLKRDLITAAPKHAAGTEERLVTDESWQARSTAQDAWLSVQTVGSLSMAFGIGADRQQAIPGPDRVATDASLLRKEFTVDFPVRSARLTITALGAYHAYINGQSIAPDTLLAPGWTDIHKRVQYRTYDVTPMLARGENTLGVVLGGGWHGLEHLLLWSDWRRQHQFLAQLCHYRKRGSLIPAT